MASKPMHGGFLSTPNTGAHNGRPNQSFAHGTPYPHSSGGQADPRLHHSMPPGGYQQQAAGHMGAGPQQGGGYPASQHGPYGGNGSGGYTGSHPGGPYGGHNSSQHGGGHGGHGGHGGGHGGYGGANHNAYSKFSRSSIFVPSTWNLNSSKAGFVDFVGRIVRQLDHQYTSDHVPMHGYHGGHGMGMGGHGMGMGGHGMGGHGMGMGGHGMGMGGHSAMGMGGHGRPGMHPAASMVSIAHDPHGMFSHPSNMSRMHMGHGRAHFSSKSVPATCPRCKHDIMTLVRRRPNVLNVAASTGAVVAGLIFKLPVALLPLAMLPLQVKALQPKVHYCPRCNYKMGKNVKISVPFDRSVVQPSPDR